MENEKHFLEWIHLKENLHNMNRLRAVHEGEIWWCAMGENIGIEINGKHEVFSRPVLVFKKLSRYGFLAIPLTSQSHEGDWYVSFMFQGRQEIAVLSQIRVMSVSRLYKRLGRVDAKDFSAIREGFRRLYLGLE